MAVCESVYMVATEFIESDRIAVHIACSSALVEEGQCIVIPVYEMFRSGIV